MLVTRQMGLDVVCIAIGRNSYDAWINAYTAPSAMPSEAYANLMSEGREGEDETAEVWAQISAAAWHLTARPAGVSTLFRGQPHPG